FCDGQTRKIFNLRRAQREGKTIPLGELLRFPYQPKTDDADAVLRWRLANAEAWALLRYLVDAKPRELRSYLGSVGRKGGEKGDEIALFEKECGKATEVEGAYLARFE